MIFFVFSYIFCTFVDNLYPLHRQADDGGKLRIVGFGLDYRPTDDGFNSGSALNRRGDLRGIGAAAGQDDFLKDSRLADSILVIFDKMDNFRADALDIGPKVSG